MFLAPLNAKVTLANDWLHKYRNSPLHYVDLDVGVDDALQEY